MLKHQCYPILQILQITSNPFFSGYRSTKQTSCEKLTNLTVFCQHYFESLYSVTNCYEEMFKCSWNLWWFSSHIYIKFILNIFIFYILYSIFILTFFKYKLWQFKIHVNKIKLRYCFKNCINNFPNKLLNDLTLKIEGI